MRHLFMIAFERAEDIAGVVKNGLSRVTRGLGFEILKAPVVDGEFATVPERRQVPIGAKDGPHEV